MDRNHLVGRAVNTGSGIYAVRSVTVGRAEVRSRRSPEPRPPVPMHRLERHTAPSAHIVAIEESRKDARL